jgi:hypothetical protein
VTIRVVAGAGGRVQRQISVGRRGTIYKQGYNTLEAPGRSADWPFLIGGVQTASGLRVVYGNCGRGFSDTPPTAPIRVSATLLTPVSDDVADYPIGDGAASSITPLRVTFDGVDDIDIAPNDFVTSDRIDITVAEGNEVMFRTFIRSTTVADIQVPCDWSTSHEGEANSWDYAGDATEDMTAVKIAEAQHFIYTPMALLAEAWT